MLDFDVEFEYLTRSVFALLPCVLDARCTLSCVFSFKHNCVSVALFVETEQKLHCDI